MTDPSPRFAEETSRNGHSLTSPSYFWDVAALLVARRKFVASVVGVATILAIVVALMLPREYAAESRVLQPEGGGLAGLMGMADRASGGLSRLLMGGGGGDYTRYLAILNSRSLREQVVQEFRLVDVYNVADRDYPVIAALERLDRNLDFRIDAEYQHLSIIAFDRDPERAAAMANFLTDELNRRHATMTSENARRTRLFVEQRLHEARADLDSARASLQAFQETHGLVELESQAQAFLSSMATQSARVAEIEVRYNTLLRQYGPDNPQVIAARDAFQSARAQEQRVIGGSEALMPVALREMPALGRQYASLLQDQLIQAQIIETIYPIYEQAQFQERSEAQAVQVLDSAVVPHKAARPSRRMIVLVTMLSALFAASLYVLGRAWIEANHREIATRLGVRERRQSQERARTTT